MPEIKAILLSAATARSSSLEEFVIESALSSANQILSDRRTFSLKSDRWNTFLSALDAPPRHLPRMEGLLKGPGFFDAEPNR